MRTLTRVVLCVAITSVCLTMTCGTAAAATKVALKGKLRACDFTVTGTSYATAVGAATASALISTTGSQVVADVTLANPSEPGTHFDVLLIQLPRPASAGCGPGNPGIAVGILDTDASGQGHTVVQGNKMQGATGAWLIVDRPADHSIDPAEFYTSEFVVPI